MEYLSSRKFSFTSQALPPDAFGVVSLEGTEGISRCYAFEIVLVSDNREVDLAGTIHQPAMLTFHRQEGDDVDFHGILLSFEQLQEIETCVLYRAHLVPRFQWLSFTHHNQVFLGKTVPEMIDACLKDGGLTSMDFELRLQGSYPLLEYVCQYEESHLAFISRWCEREGIYYFFEQTDRGEKIIFTDTRITHTYRPQGKIVFYSPPSGLEAFHEKEVIRSFTCTYSPTPANILLKDYHYMKPSLDITGSAEVDANGRGGAYFYGDHIRTPEEGNRLAKIRAESLLCRRELFEAESGVPYISPGFTFDLKDHYRAGFNQTYLVTEVRHEGNQAGYLVSGLTLTSGEREEHPFYTNTFTAIPAGLRYRPERLTPKPRIPGAISAKIDAASSGQYAELDEYGRYKVILPFDTSGRKNGKASAWIRMATPYIGSDHGMHFPLHKDTEVLLTFIDGDPDRPVIASALPNPENPSPVSSANQTRSAITTASGNKIHIEDQAGSERILMHTPKKPGFIRIGAHNDPDGEDERSDLGIAEKTGGCIEIQARGRNELILGEAGDVVLGLRTWFTTVGAIDIVFPIKYHLRCPQSWSLVNGHVETGIDEFHALVDETIARAIDNEITGRKESVSGLIEQFVGNKLRTIGDLTDIVTQDVQTVLDANTVASNAVRTQIADLNGANTRIGNVLSRIKTEGTSMKTAGQNIEEEVQATRTVGTLIDTSGASIVTAGSIIETAGLTLVN